MHRLRFSHRNVFGVYELALHESAKHLVVDLELCVLCTPLHQDLSCGHLLSRVWIYLMSCLKRVSDHILFNSHLICPFGELVWHRRGQAGARQAEGATVGLTHCTGGGIAGLDHGACAITLFKI